MQMHGVNRAAGIDEAQTNRISYPIRESFGLRPGPSIYSESSRRRVAGPRAVVPATDEEDTVRLRWPISRIYNERACELRFVSKPLVQERCRISRAPIVVCARASRQKPDFLSH